MHRLIARCVPALLLLPLLTLSTGCDIMTAHLRAEETAEWHRSYPLDRNGRVEIANVNGKIDVVPAEGNTVDVVAIKKARGATSDAAKAALERITIGEEASSSSVKIETKIDKGGGGMFDGGSLQVEYRVKVPRSADVKFTTVNGGIEIAGLNGRINAETTNGGVRARDVEGQIEASTTNGGIDIDLTRMPEAGVKLECTNGGISLRLPRDAKATISARISNGGINTGDLPIEQTGETNRRRLEGRLNGGGPRVDIEGTNGGIRISGR